MANGLFKDNAGWVRVNFDGKYMLSMKRVDYEDHDYKPQYSALPTKEKYEKANAKGS